MNSVNRKSFLKTSLGSLAALSLPLGASQILGQTGIPSQYAFGGEFKFGEVNLFIGQNSQKEKLQSLLYWMGHTILYKPTPTVCGGVDMDLVGGWFKDSSGKPKRGDIEPGHFCVSGKSKDDVIREDMFSFWKGKSTKAPVFLTVENIRDEKDLDTLIQLSKSQPNITIVASYRNDSLEKRKMMEARVKRNFQLGKVGHHYDWETVQAWEGDKLTDYQIYRDNFKTLQPKYSI